MESTNRLLYLALLEAQKAAKAVLKLGYDRLHDFDYARSEDVIAAGKEALNDSGLILERKETVVDEPRHLIYMTFNLIHAESGTKQEYYKEQFYTDCVTASDKLQAQLATETIALSYLYRDILSLPRGISTKNPARQNLPYPSPEIRTVKTHNVDSFWQTMFVEADQEGLNLAYSDVPMSMNISDYNETVHEIDKAIRKASFEWLDQIDCSGFIERQTHLTPEAQDYLLSLVHMSHDRFIAGNLRISYKD